MSEELANKINDYLAGRLSGTDLIAFENAVKADDTLAKAVAVSKLEKESIELLIENDLRANIAFWKSEKKAKKP